MFEISWSELLILAVVTLIFVGPKDLPVFMRTVGRYTGALRRQAAEFRRHFDEAMRDAEMENLRKEFDEVRAEVARTARQAEQSVSEGARAVETNVASAKSTAAVSIPATQDPDAPVLPSPSGPAAGKPGA